MNNIPDISRLIIIKCQLQRVIDAGAGGDLGLHGDVGDTWRGEAAEDIVKGDEGGLCGGDDTLAPALAPHVHPAVLAHGGRDVVVVRGRHLHDPPQLLPHLGRGAGVRLVPWK